MSITFYCGSGSPLAWRVWLALEHKQLPYELKMLSFQARDTRKPEYLAINPRGKVPSIVEDGFALWESAAILEYLDDRHPERPLFPTEIKKRAEVRRLVHEADSFLMVPMEELVEELLFNREQPNPARMEKSLQAAREELGHLERQLSPGQEWLAGPLSAADFTVEPLLALTDRLARRANLPFEPGPLVTAWRERMAALPYYARTWPPHWK